MSKVLTKQDILGLASDLSIRKLDIPEWGGSVCIRIMTAGERDRWEADQIRMQQENSHQRLHDSRARLLAICCCDEDGKQLFTVEDIPAISSRSSLVVERITSEIMRLNEIGAKAIEEAEKNSEGAR